ncbi:alkaline phosphatase family protein [Microvirga sp. SRT01]|uniref:Alkaline phosphatase n=1 Tax=Sphingomonas longa TaxID=2778730 RepID=A0ABS2D771_9SPHN|nr:MULTISPECIES: alkaline phosphatase family protein [Alphaproteobacteria]MBM6575894.1 alkaline phosphatase family protein [Sphingomonas sp. BT552]MBR7708940.1 alkaline phosphatase family protein [Microvirga sp. SRT01]
MKAPLPAALCAALLLLSAPAAAQTAPAAAPAPFPATPPKLIVAISVDQFSADLFAQYRNHYTGGLARLLTGGVFPSGYQSHAATETCPGHSTILTGYRPANTGIIANNWIDQRVGRPDKTVYCSEDESVAGSDHNSYTVSDIHLKVPTLGERMKTADPRSRVVSVAGKDRAAVMMGGHKVDELWWWDGKTYVSYAGRAVPPVVQRTRDAVAALLAQPQAALPLPGWCKPLDRPITVGDQTLGQGRFERAAGDAKAFRASPASDAAVLAMAAGLVQDMKLGAGPAADIIAVGLSATDYIGHSRGTQGTEMCIQMDQLDQALAGFFAVLDATGVDYEVMLTADHGAHDMTERQQQRAMPMEAHIDPQVQAKALGAAIGRDLKLAGPVLLGSEGDVYLSSDLPARERPRVLAEALRRYRAMPQVAGAYDAKEVAATPMPSGAPETWTLLQKARASYDAQRSGDLLVFLKPRVTSIEVPAAYYVETHGSPWDYDRRVPILFWRKGMTGFEQPLSVETVDIMPTLAATIGLKVAGQDGRCLDLDPGPADTCSR